MKHLKNFAFRFFLVYFVLTIAPWLWFNFIPGVAYVTKYYSDALEWIVFRFNDWLLHVKPVLNTQGFGSGDTSYYWAEFYTIIIISFIAGVAWTLFDKKEKEHRILEYWLHNLIRYYLIYVALNYGIIKLFALQMPFPNLSQLATPLGDFLPMRLSWMFIGYSQPYEMFSGVMEVMVALLLIYRRTIPLGLFIGLGVFSHVFVLNMCYDIPVKLYSMQIVICYLFLIIIDYKRYLNFFILNKPTVVTTGYNYRFTKKWQNVGRIILKTVFLALVIGWNFYDCINWYNETHATEASDIPQGVYSIKTFKKNDQILTIDATDTLAWRDFIFDREKIGSIKTSDTIFRKRYGRGYFNYQTDKSKQTIAFKKAATDTLNLFVMNYRIVDKNMMQLKGVINKDTVYYELVKSDQNFPLAEKQFHWISEANR